MDPRALAVAEMTRRTGLVPSELMAWEASAQANEHFMGIHGTQLASLQVMMNDRQKQQVDLLEKLSAELPPPEFAKAYGDLLDEVVGAHDLWRAFRTILDQQLDSRLGTPLVTLSVIAAECYNTVMDRAQAWGAPAAADRRPPPLVYLAALRTPETVSRGGLVEQLGLSVERYKGLPLPIPVVFMPLDQVFCPWHFVTIHHEVGHNIDQDLDLSSELSEKLRQSLDPVNSERARLWATWTPEVLADTLGLVLGGAGFGVSLASLLLLLAPAQTELDRNDAHPPHLVRAHLLAALLSVSPPEVPAQVPAWSAAARKIRAWMAAQTTPAWAQAFIEDGPRVATVCLSAPLAGLGARSTWQVTPDRAKDAELIESLGDYLATGLLAPDAKSFPWRLVPAAAQLALEKRIERDPPETAQQAVDTVQSLAIGYTKLLKVPTWLASPKDYTAAVLRRSRSIRFAR